MPIASALRSALLVFGVALTALVSPSLLAAGSMAADGYNPNVNGNVYAVVLQPDGKLLIAGNFTSIQPNGAPSAVLRNSIARLNPDGSNDASLASEVAGQITAMVLQPDGKIVIGGKFTAVNNAGVAVPRNRIARLNADGTLDTTFDPNIGGGLTPDVTCLALQPLDGKILVGGGFTSVQPNGASAATTRNRILRLNKDGTLDTSFDPNANNTVLSLAVQADGKILVGGGFTTLQPAGDSAATTRNRIARLTAEGKVDASFDPNANNAVSAIAVLPDGKILIGGTFTTLQPNGAGAAITSEIRMARLNSDGTADTDFYGYADAGVDTIVVQNDGKILVGGSFSALSNGTRPYAGRLLPTGYVDEEFLPSPNFRVYAFAPTSDGSVILAGGFTTLRGYGVTSTVRNHIARVIRSGALDTDFRPDVNGRVRSLAVQSDGKLLVGGSFTSIAGTTASGLVRLLTDGKVDTTFKPQVNSAVAVAAPLSNGKILIGGSFTQVSGVARSYLARLNADGTIDDTFKFGINGAVNDIKVQSDGKVILVGSFTQVAPFATTEPLSRNYIARMNADDSLDLTFSPATNNTVFKAALQADGKIIIGGTFSAVSGTGGKSSAARSSVARFNADGSLDTVFNPNLNNAVYAIAIQSDEKVLLAGAFTKLAPNDATTVTDRSYIVRVNKDGSLDSTFEIGLNNAVTTIALSGGNILIGGLFTNATSKGATSPSDRTYLARLDSTGKLDSSFDIRLDTLPGNQVVALAQTPAGATVVAGAFTMLTPSGGAAVSRNRLAQITAAGAIDTAFNSDLSSAAGAAIKSLSIESDGQVIIAGDFSKINGSGSTGLAVFYSDGTPNVGFVPTITGSINAVARHISNDAVDTQKTGFAWLQSTGKLKPGFAFPSNLTFGAPTAVAVQPDGKLLIAGTFTVLTGDKKSTQKLLRFLPDGSIDSTFNMNIVDGDTDNDGILDATDDDIDGDGIKNDTDTDDDGDGILDVDEDPNAAQPVTVDSISAITLQSDGKILIGGTFSAIENTTRSNFARLNSNGSLDTTFSANTNNVVSVIKVQADGKILIGGTFTTVQTNSTSTSYTRNYIARVGADGTVETPFDPSLNSSVTAIVVRSDNKILVGGNFTTVKPNGATTTTDRTYIAQFNADGTLDTTVDLKLNGAVSSLALQSDGKIVVGGYFTSVLSQPHSYLVRLNTDSTLDTNFNPNPNNGISSVVVQSDGKLLVMGSFSGFQPNSTAYDAGNTTPRSYAARLNSDGTLDGTFNPNFNSNVTRMVQAPDGTIVVLGSFTSIQPVGAVLVGGNFSAVSGVEVHNLAVFGRDGSVSAFQPNPNGAVNALAIFGNGQVVVGGAFTHISDTDRNRLARFLATDSLDSSSLDTSYNPNISGEVFALAPQPDGKLLVGGSFTSVGGAAHANIARINADGSVDSSFNASASGAVRAIAVQADGRILFTSETSSTANVLMRVDAAGNVDSSFNPANDGAVYSIATQADGHIVVGGSFTSIVGVSRSNLARLNSDGTVDTSVTAKPNGAVTAVAVEEDGKIVIAGKFSSVDDLPRFGIARIGAPTAATQSFTRSSDQATLTWVRGGGNPVVSGVIFESSTDGSTWTKLGTATHVANTANWSYPIASVTDRYIRAVGIVPNSGGGSSGMVSFRGVATSLQPVISNGGAVVSAASGSTFYYTITATNGPTGYSATGLPPGLTINSTTGLISGTPTQQGQYTVVITATNGYGSATANIIINVGAPQSGKAVMVNISTRAYCSTGDNVTIGGFVISAGTTKRVLVRAVGPSLTSYGLAAADVLADPVVEVYSGSTKIATNDNVSDNSNATEVTAISAQVGAGALLSSDTKSSALVLSLAPGNYTFITKGKSDTSGIVLLEVYDVDGGVGSTFLNISSRAYCSTADRVAIGGFVISGSASKKVLIRAVGPTLTAHGIASAAVLANPVLELHRGSPKIAENDDSGTNANAAEIVSTGSRVGAFPLDASDTKSSALLLDLPAGAYSFIVNGSGGTSGLVLIEVYDAD